MAIVSSTLFGLGMTLGARVLQDVPPETTTGLRFGIVALVSLPIALRTGWPLAVYPAVMTSVWA